MQYHSKKERIYSENIYYFFLFLNSITIPKLTTLLRQMQEKVLLICQTIFWKNKKLYYLLYRNILLAELRVSLTTVNWKNPKLGIKDSNRENRDKCLKKEESSIIKFLQIFKTLKFLNLEISQFRFLHTFFFYE